MMVVEVYFVPAGRRAFHQNDELTLVGAWRRPILMPRGDGVGNTNDGLSNRPQPCSVEEGSPLSAGGLLPPPMDRLRIAANIEPESRNDRPLPRAIASLSVRPVIGRLFIVRSVTEIIFAGTIRTTIVGSASNGACPFVICPRVQIDSASRSRSDHAHPLPPSPCRIFPAPPAWLQPARPVIPPPPPAPPPARPAAPLQPRALQPPPPWLPRSPRPSPRRPYQSASGPEPPQRSPTPTSQGPSER